MRPTRARVFGRAELGNNFSIENNVRSFFDSRVRSQRGFLCIALHRRSDHIVEIQIGKDGDTYVFHFVSISFLVVHVR